MKIYGIKRIKGHIFDINLHKIQKNVDKIKTFKTYDESLWSIENF